MGVSVAVALLAGLVGGLLGGVLADRTVVEGTTGPAPSPGVGATTRPNGSVANIAARATPSVVTLRVEGADGEGTGSGWVYDRKPATSSRTTTSSPALPTVARSPSCSRTASS